MADIGSLATSLQTKMRSVPNVLLDDCVDWVTTATTLHGVDLTKYTDLDEVLVLLLAQAEACRNVALNVSHYFKWQDGEDQVDKTKVADQYLKLSADFLKSYMRRVSEGTDGNGSTFYNAVRADRQ